MLHLTYFIRYILIYVCKIRKLANIIASNLIHYYLITKSIDILLISNKQNINLMQNNYRDLNASTKALKANLGKISCLLHLEGS